MPSPGSSDYQFFLKQALDGKPDVEAVEGGSGYFSTPDSGLDPRLFGPNEVMHEPVRQWLLKTLDAWLEGWLESPELWSTAWLAGSGISYQWAADRSNGDLDVLYGIDWPEFYRINEKYRGFSEIDMADLINTRAKDELWPLTANTDLGIVTGGKPSGMFEVTFYVNPHSTDIRDINPYAAYNLVDNRWTVRPPVLPDNPETLYPQHYFDTVNAERKRAGNLISNYNTEKGLLASLQPGSPGWLNSMRQVDLIVSQADAMFDDIHLARKQAFAPGGGGYGDFYNFRWQSHKRYGTVQALNDIASTKHDARKAQETALYGAPLASATDALRAAILGNRQV